MIFDASEGVYNVLNNDVTLSGILTGGIYYANDILYTISQRATPAAFDGSLMKPNALVVNNAQRPDGAIGTQLSQLQSFTQLVDIMLMDDPSATWSTLDSAGDRVYELLQGSVVTGYGHSSVVTVYRFRNPDYQGAIALYMQVDIRGIRG